MALRKPLPHADLWAGWLLLGDSVSVQWVPSHVGVEGNEQTDLWANKGAQIAQDKVVVYTSVTENWADLGLHDR